MKLLCLTDLHGRRDRLWRVIDHAGSADVFVLGGDLTDFGTPSEAETLIRIAQEFCPQVVAVAGNCDSPQIDQRLSDLGVSVFRRGVVIQDIGFLGVSAMPPWHGTMYELSEDAIAESLQQGRRQLGSNVPRVVVSHAPPHGTVVDRVSSGEHVGSVALRAFITADQPDLVVCGHIHEARGIDTIGATTVVNCGPGKAGCYAIVNLGDTIAVELRSATPRQHD